MAGLLATPAQAAEKLVDYALAEVVGAAAVVDVRRLPDVTAHPRSHSFSRNPVQTNITDGVDQASRLPRVRRERECARAALDIIDDDPAVAINHERLRFPMQRGFENGNQREIFGLAAVALPRRRADFEHVAVRTF